MGPGLRARLQASASSSHEKGLWLYIGVIYWDNGKQNGNYRDYRGWDYIGIMEKKMETTIIYMGFL